MTSKNLCFKLMKEDLKRRIWTISLLMLSFFFGIVLPIFYVGANDDYDFRRSQRWLTYLRESIERLLGVGNGLIIVVLVVAAVVCAVSGFSYLHSAKKVDLYHSMPVKRGQLFLATYLNGIFMTGGIYLLALLIAVIAAAAFGVGFNITVPFALSAYAFQMSYYILMYTTVVVAMLLTGNVIITLLATVVFYFYAPCMIVIIQGYIMTWFKTYANLNWERFFEKITTHSSPFINYVVNLGKYDTIHLFVVVELVLLISAILAVFSWWLYKKRPSEAAGRAIAFQVIKMPIKVLIVIPVSLGFCLIFWSMRSNMGWAIFGLICGGVLTHCLMEIIYHFDFRKLFSNKRHLGFCLVVSAVILCGFRYDWFGYDSYLPKEQNVKSAAITVSGAENWVSYGGVKKTQFNDGVINYSWEYGDQSEYAAEHMKITDLTGILSIAQKGIESNKEMDISRNQRYYRYGYQSYTISYTLNNGKVVTRSYYSIPETMMVEEELARIFDSQEYKQGVFPILSQKPEDTTRVRFQQFNQISTVDVAKDSPELAELLAAYQEDLRAQTVESRKTENPLATIQFMTQDMDDAIYLYGSNLNDNEYRYYVYNIEDRCYYPLYPSFKKTLALLEKAGVEVKEGLTADMIGQVTLRVYQESQEDQDAQDVQVVPNAEAVVPYDREVMASKDYSDAYIKTYNLDRGEIEALAPALIYSDYVNMNPDSEIKLVDYIEDISVIITNGTSDKTVTCYIDEDKMPDFMKQFTYPRG